MRFYSELELMDAINNFCDENIYDATIAFYRTLNFCVTPITNFILDKPMNFIYAKHDLKVFLCKNDIYILNSVKSISIIFELDVNNIEYSYIKVSKYLNKYIKKIIFLAVELEDSCLIRSEVINSLTIILSKIYNNPILVLFKHIDHIALSGKLSFNGDQQLVTEVFLSDWYNVSCVDQESFYKLSLMKYEYHKDSNILELYLDLMFSISRQYYINPESYEYIKYQVFPPTEDEPYYLDANTVCQNMNHCKEYGDDFIFNQNVKLETDEDLLKDDCDILDFEIFGEIFSDDQKPEDFLPSYEDIYDEQEEDVEVDIFKKLGHISDEDYDDPIKLLELINEVDT